MSGESPYSSSGEHVRAETPTSSSPRQRKPVEEITDPLVLAASLFEELRKIKETLQQENHKKRLLIISERLDEEKKDVWKRPAIDQILRY
uniref:N-acetylglucosaminyldiphosphodolichol N-acetylglucosaminyltransferase n=1 Tax=Parascaris univalens TaxID=6257 RepID=A0A914ZH03_PARUN